MELIRNIIGGANGILWGAPMLALMLISGGLFTVRTGFFQLRHPLYILRRTVLSRDCRNAAEGSVTPFQAMSSALAATLGTGNIAGVAAALASGGPGAVFWLWISAMLGMMTGYAENYLGAAYRARGSGGERLGGAMYYIRDGLSENRFTKPIARPLAAVYAAACVLSAFGMGNLVQMNSSAQAVEAGFGIPGEITGAALALLAAVIFFGGRSGSVRRTARFTELLVPLMSAMYIAASVYILAVNFTRLPAVLGLIFRSAFGLEQAAGGVSGYLVKQAVSMGFRRGVFSNEAGLGTSVAAHAASDFRDPCTAGMWSIFEVFFDTIVMCSMTAFVLLACPCREPSAAEAFHNVSLSPQYFRLTEGDGMITAGTPSICAGGGNAVKMRSEGGVSFTVELSEGEYTFSNVMKLTGVQARSASGEPLYLDSGAPRINSVRIEEVTGAELMLLAFSTVFGSAAGKILSGAVALFAFSTVIGWGSFGAQAAVYLFGSRAELPFRIVFTIAAAFGGIVDVTAAWGAADMFNGMMAAVNLPVILFLSGKIGRIAVNTRREH